MTKHLLVAVLAITACISTDEPGVASLESEVSSCVAEKLRFKNFGEASACAKDNPEMVVIALNAIVKSGGTCTQTDRDGLCTSITPVADSATERLIGNPIDCMTFWVNNRAQHMQCCSLDQFGGFDSDRCFSAPYSLEMY